jgi:hypothetical protein
MFVPKIINTRYTKYHPKLYLVVSYGTKSEKRCMMYTERSSKLSFSICTKFKFFSVNGTVEKSYTAQYKHASSKMISWY